MDKPTVPAAPLRTYAWWLILGLVGLDYFSTLAYLPSVAVSALQDRRELAPLVALGVVMVTLFLAVPIYAYVVGRSPNGEGATGLLERLVRGWTGKLLILVLLGFVGTDFVITRTLSFADASTHLIQNPFWRQEAHWVTHNKEAVRSALPGFLQGAFFDYWTEQLVLTVLLLLVSFAFYFFVQVGLTPRFLKVAAVIVAIYLTLNAVLIGCCIQYLLERPELLRQWLDRVHAAPPVRPGARTAITVILVALATFPQLALGLSGFELSMATAPLITGGPSDTPEKPRRRVRRARIMMLVAAVIMSVFIAGAVLVVTLLIPPELFGQKGPAHNRALAWLAHGGNEQVSPLFGRTFGTIYDLSTVVILCLAGASATVSLRDLVPRYLARYGMQLRWAAKVGVILHLFNVIILLVTFVFRASVSNQQEAYAASVLVLLTAAAVAAYLDIRHRFAGFVLRPVMLLPFFLVVVFFLSMALLTTILNASGLAIALVFIATVLGTAITSRWMRSTELRFDGFQFVDAASEKRWAEITNLEFQVLVPHRPGLHAIADKENEIREMHRIGKAVPIIFVEVEVGDPSDFQQRPLMKIEHENGREIIRLSHCVSVAHVLAAVALEFRHVGQPPEMIFGWSIESPLAANLDFLLMGRGNVPWMVNHLIRRAEPEVKRRPRVIVG